MEEFCRRKSAQLFHVVACVGIDGHTPVTNIPLETAHQDGPASATRPPWIRPVRKKAPSIAHSNQSGDSPSHQSSPEAFSPQDFFEPPKSTVFAAGPSSAAGTPANQAASPPQYGNGAGPQPNASFMDTSGALGDMDIMRDEHMYGMTSDMMALFQDSGVESMFAPEFLQQQPHLVSGQQTHRQPDRQGNGSGTTPNVGFSGSGLFKINGLASSP